jgi:hypothetical protein
MERILAHLRGNLRQMVMEQYKLKKELRLGIFLNLENFMQNL